MRRLTKLWVLFRVDDVVDWNFSRFLGPWPSWRSGYCVFFLVFWILHTMWRYMEYWPCWEDFCCCMVSKKYCFKMLWSWSFSLCNFQENRICVMVHIVLSILFLMLYKVAIIYEVISTLMDMHVYIDALFITVYFVLCPLLWAFFWYIQFCAFRFYQYLGNS